MAWAQIGDCVYDLPQAAPILFSFRLAICNARPIYIYICDRI